MPVRQNHLIIRQGTTLDEQIKFVKKPTGAQTIATADAYPLTGTGVRGRLEDEDHTELIDLAPTYHDAPNGIIRVQLTPAQTAALPVTKAFCDFHEDFAGGVIKPLHRILFSVIHQSTDNP